MEEYQITQGKKLRCGYTTGSCATAAAKAATTMLLGQELLVGVKIDTPKGIVLQLALEDIERTATSVSCAIRKDAGDDPDDTHGILIYVRAEKTLKPGLELVGGTGVGTVTKPGLACSVGGPAINPTPRRMITENVRAVCRQFNYTGGLKLTLSIPEGVTIAKKTFNPRLGIINGLSILGTSGIVEPMSEKALVDTMYVEMNVQKEKGNKHLLVFFGNYGEDYTREVLGLDISEAITCSNFVGELLDYAVYSEFESILLIGHSGKLVKLVQGVMNTHSKYADCRTESLALYALLAGASVSVGQEILTALTTDEAIKILKREELLSVVMERLTEKIDFYMQHRVHNKIKTGALMFSNVHGVLGQTGQVAELLKLHTKGNTKC
ncbi:MAG: cobalt-precorrin-5B (C(1))-methyltransferase CbiD [Acidaminococcaceae bacterium]